MAPSRPARIAIVVATMACLDVGAPSRAADAPDASAASPPACDAFTPSRTRQPAFAPRPDAPAPVCEGFVEQPVAEPFLELVSLTRGAARLEAAAPVRLVQAATPVARVVLQPRSGTPLYRVEASLPAGRPLSWDPATMLHATGLQPRDIAFLARAPDDGSRRLRAAPVRLEPASATHDPHADAAPATVYAVIRTSVDISSLSWRAYDEGRAVDAPFHEAADSALFAWQTYALALPAVPPAHARVVEVAARNPGGRPLPLLVVTVLGEQP